MKPRSLLIALSVAFNVALLAMFVLQPAATSALFRDAFQGGHRSETSASNTSHAADATKDAAAVAAAARAASAWPEFQSGDFAGLVARLRAAGFPPSIIRAVVQTAVSEHFSARRRELMPRPVMSSDYWKNPRQNIPFDPTAQKAMRELGREQTNLLKELLGPDFGRPTNDEWFLADQRRRFGDLPAAKVDQLQKIDSDYNDLRSKVHDDSMGILLPEDRAKLALLEREQRADFERLFTPEELLDYDLRNSRAANELRNRFGQFEATEEEFRSLYAAQKAFTEQNPNPEFGPPSPDTMRQRAAAQEALEAQFKSLLGDDRYAEMKKTNSPGRRNGNEELVGRLVTRLNLPPATTATVLSVQTDIQQRASAVQSDRTLPPDQRLTQLSKLAAEASSKLTETLGSNGLEAYKQYGGQWLQQLTPPVRPGAPAPAPRN